MKKLLFILLILFCGFIGMSQTKYNLPYDSVLVKQLTKNSHFYVKGTGYFTDTVTVTTLDTTDNSNRAASTAFVRTYVSGHSGGGGNTNSNIGSGYRLAVPITNNIKTLFTDLTGHYDSSSNSNALTYKVDTVVMATRGRVQKGLDSLAVVAANSTLFPLTGAGTATGNVTGDLGAFDLNIIGSVNTHVHMDDGTNSGKLDVSKDADVTGISWSKNDNSAGSFMFFGNDITIAMLGTGTAKYLSDYSSNYTSRSLVDSGFVGSVIRGDSLLPVTARGNSTDSILYNNVTAFGLPAQEYVYGTSIDLGLQASVIDSSYANRTALGYGLTLTNNSVSSRGSWQAAALDLAQVNTGHTKLVITGGPFNDARRGGSERKTLNKIINSFKAMWINQFLSTLTAANAVSTSIVKSGSWGNYDASFVGGKTNAGAYTQTVNDSIAYTFVGYKNIAIGAVSFDSTNQSGAKFAIHLYAVGGSDVVNTVYTENGQIDGISDGSNNNQRGAMAFEFTGLNIATTYKVVLVSLQGTNVLAVDYFGHMVDADVAMPIVFLHPSYMDATGYATIQPPFTANSTMDSVATVIDSMAAQVPTGYPVFVARTNDYFIPIVGQGLYSDHIHMTDQGFREQTEAIYAVLPSVSPIRRDGTMFRSVNHLYVVLGGTPVQLDNSSTTLVFSTGLTNTSNTITANLSTGVSGGQTLIGSTSTTSGITYKATTGVGTTGADHIFTGGNNGATEIFRATSAGYVGIGVTPGSFMLDVKSRASGDGGIRIKEAVGQTEVPLRITNSSDVVKLKVDPDGGLQILGGITSYGGASITLQMSGGAGYMDFYDGGSWLTGNIRFGTLNLQPAGSTIAQYTSGGLVVGGGGAINASAALEVNSTTKGFRLTPMTATQASAITPVEGLILSVSNTNGTFTAIGIWGYQNGAWTQF